MSQESFVVCALNSQNGLPVVLSAYQGPRNINQDYFYWSTNHSTWLAFEHRETALEEGAWLLSEYDATLVLEASLWVMPYTAAAQLVGGFEIERNTVRGS